MTNLSKRERNKSERLAALRRRRYLKAIEAKDIGALQALFSEISRERGAK